MKVGVVQFKLSFLCFILILLDCNREEFINRKCQHYVYVKWEYQSTMLKMKYCLKRKNKVNENKILSYCEALRYM